MVKRYYFILVCVAVMAVIVFSSIVSIYATPSFARREGGVSCNFCHWHQNALNANGKDFLRRGVRLAEEKADASQEELKIGHYASVVLHPTISAVENDSTQFSAGDVVLWLGAPIDNKFSALAEVEFKVDEEEVEVEEIYAQYVSSLRDKYFSVRAGQFQPFILISQVSGPARITLSRPEAISGRATNGNSFRPRSRLRGMELGGVYGPFSGYVGVGNGPGQNEDDNHMDTYAAIEGEIGEKGSSIGVWAYWGEASLEDNFRDSFSRYGVIGNYTMERTRLVGGYLLGSNDDPTGVTLDNDGWFIEVDQNLWRDITGYVRWDNFTRDLAAGSDLETDGPTLGISWIITPLTRLTVEGQQLDTDSTERNSVTAELQIVF